MYTSSPSQFQVGLPGTCELVNVRSSLRALSIVVVAVAREMAKTKSGVRTYEITFVKVRSLFAW